MNAEDAGGKRVAALASLDGAETATSAVADLVVVAEFCDPIYPGLKPIARMERGRDKPFHTVTNAENSHALQILLFTPRGQVGCIYIDPPSNSGAKDWTYNNHYVESLGYPASLKASYLSARNSRFGRSASLGGTVRVRPSNPSSP